MKLDTKGEKDEVIKRLAKSDDKKAKEDLAGGLIEVIEGSYAGMTDDQAMIEYRKTSVEMEEEEIIMKHRQIRRGKKNL